MLSNAYFLAKFRFDTAENEPAKNLQKHLANFANFANSKAHGRPWHRQGSPSAGRRRARRRGPEARGFSRRLSFCELYLKMVANVESFSAVSAPPTPPRAPNPLPPAGTCGRRGRSAGVVRRRARAGARGPPCTSARQGSLGGPSSSVEVQSWNWVSTCRQGSEDPFYP